MAWADITMTTLCRITMITTMRMRMGMTIRIRRLQRSFRFIRNPMTTRMTTDRRMHTRKRMIMPMRRRMAMRTPRHLRQRLPMTITKRMATIIHTRTHTHEQP